MSSILLALADPQNNNDVFTINTDGSDLKQLTDSPGYDGQTIYACQLTETADYEFGSIVSIKVKD